MVNIQSPNSQLYFPTATKAILLILL